MPIREKRENDAPGKLGTVYVSLLWFRLALLLSFTWQWFSVCKE